MELSDAEVERLGELIAVERDKHPRMATDMDSWELAHIILSRRDEWEKE